MGRNTIVISGLLLAIFGMVTFVLMMITGFITGIISSSFAVGMIATVIVGVYILGSIPGLKFFRSRIFIGMIIVSGLVGLYQRLPEIVANFQKEGERYAESQSPETLKGREEESLVLVKKGTALYKRNGYKVVFDKKMEKDLFCRITDKFLSTDEVRYIEFLFPKLNEKKEYMDGVFDDTSVRGAVLASDYEKSLADIKAEDARAKAEADAKEKADAEAKAKALEKIRQEIERKEVAERVEKETEERRKLVEEKRQREFLTLTPYERGGERAIFRLPKETNYGDKFEFLEAVAVSRGDGMLSVGYAATKHFKTAIPAGFVFAVPGEAVKKDGCFEIIMDRVPTVQEIKLKKKGGV